MSLTCSTLSPSACSVLSLLMASPMDCSAPVAADGLLTQAQAVPGGDWGAGFRLTQSCTLASLPAVRVTRGATGFGFFSEQFHKAGFRNGPWVLLQLPSCRQWLHCVILHMLAITTSCPTEGFLMLLASFDPLHLPLLGLCTHPHSACTGTFHAEFLVGCSHVSRSQLYAFSSLLQSKLMPGKGVVNEDFV